MFFAVVEGYFAQSFNQLRAVAIECHYIGGMCRKFIVDNNLATSRFVQYSNFYTIAEVGFAINDNKVAVVDYGTLANRVVGDVVVDIFDKAVVPYTYIVECGIANARVHLDATFTHK